jgi:hypothetical protein
VIGRTDDLERDVSYINLLLHVPLPPAMDAPDLKFWKLRATHRHNEHQRPAALESV